MARSISDLHNFIDLVTSQERGGFNIPAEKDEALYNASLSLFEYYRPLYGKDIEARQALAPFRAKYDYTTDGAGLIAVPSGQNMVHLLSMDVSVVDASATSAGYVSPRRWAVRFPNEDELSDAKNSQLNKPTSTNVYADITAVNTYELTPSQTHTGTIRFLKEPTKPVYNFTQSGDTITYNPTGSVQLEWVEPYLNKVLFLALRYLGINMESENVIRLFDQFFKESP